jgi:YD repeat-containing protein
VTKLTYCLGGIGSSTSAVASSNPSRVSINCTQCALGTTSGAWSAGRIRGQPPTSPDAFAYDGEGNRVAQKVTTRGTSTTTYYIGGVEEQTGSTIARYCTVPGLPTAVNVGGTISYLASDGISSVSEALDGSGQGKLSLPRMWRNPGVDIAASGDYI